MKKILVFCFMFCLLILNVQAKDVAITSVELNATIQENGIVRIEEIWNVDFDGIFKNFKRDIPIAPGDKFLNPQVYINDEVIKDFKETENTFSNFNVEEKTNGVSLNIHREYMNKHTRFRLVYEMDGVIHRYQDVAEFNYHLLGDQWDYPIPILRGSIRFPAVDKQEPLYVWTHSKAKEDVQLKSNSEVFIQASNVNKFTGLNVRMALPSRMFEGLDIQSGNHLNQMIKEEEKLLSKEKNSGYINAFLCIATLVGAFYIFKKARYYRTTIINAYRPLVEPQFYDHLPSDLTPAEVVTLLNYEKNRYDTKQIYLSTLLSLASKGVISIEIKDETSFYRVDETKAQNPSLKKHERIFIEFLLDCVNKKGFITNKSIERFSKYHSQKTMDHLTGFDDAVSESLESQGYYGRIQKPAHFIILTILYIIYAFFFSFYLFIPGIIGFLMGLYSLIILGLAKGCSQKGDNEAALWIAFDNYLSSLKTNKQLQVPTLDAWKSFLPYGVAFGYGESILKYLPELYDDFYAFDSYFHCFYLNNVFVPLNFTNLNHLGDVVHVASVGGSQFTGGGGISGGGGGSFS